MSGHSRRGAIGILGAAAAATLLSSHSPLLAAAGRDEEAGWTPGLQLYTIGDALTKDFAGTLQFVRQIGFRAVELPSHYGRTAAELRRALDDAGLACRSISAAPWSTPDMWALRGDIDRLADDCHRIGADYVIVPIMQVPDSVIEAMRNPPPGGFDKTAVKALFDRVAADDWMRTADLLNERSAFLARAGIRLAYHNHAHDFRPLAGGEIGYDLLLAHTDPKLVRLELDVGWAVSAGQDLDGLLRRIGTRVELMHLKDVRQPSGPTLEMEPADIGTGIVPWTSLAAWVRTLGIRHLFVEQEPPFPGAPMDSVRTGFRYLSELFASSQGKGNQ